ncbi:MAG TPA: molybdenum cofactor biosynthesis protein MoaE [Deltaproteobacteria bacterium]|jgi:molybdopterin synthase catalytic subunit|nr:molybdenum cofactor biosynthesis protein MoaE [Deltaproteobacteria bacterium]
MRVRLRLFGAVREAVGSKELELSLAPGVRVADLRALLLRQFPGLGPLDPRVRISVNQEFAEGDALLAEGDEVALLPPVAGGAGACTISSSSLDVEAVVKRVTGPGVGGVVTFIGTVRDHARGRSIRHLEYEAYPEMAEREMERIADEAAARFPGARVAITHRTGHLEVGEIAVVVAAAAPHRAEAFSACRFAIDTLKERVPIWKKEIASDGAYWVDDHA